MEKFDFTPVPLTRPLEKHQEHRRKWQGIPSITASPGGRVFAAWYSGGEGECAGNFVLVAISDDKNQSWSAPVWVVDPPQENIRAFDPSMFTAPDGRVFLFWSQCYSEKVADIFDGRNGVWYSVCENPDDEPEKFKWSLPVRICDGVMMNKPIVMTDGTWALPVSVWNLNHDRCPEKDTGAFIYVSEDRGRSFSRRGGVIIPRKVASYDEHSIYERKDRSLVMLIRVKCGFYETVSTDGGFTWSEPCLSDIPGPNTRAYIGRLHSGKLLLVYNDAVFSRCNMTAALSSDDGRTFPEKIMIDMRKRVSYPDVIQSADGTIYIIYDHDRYNGGTILCTNLTQADVENGKMVTPASWAARPVSTLLKFTPPEL